MAEVTALHGAILPTVTARIGKPYLRTIYATLLADPVANRLFVAETEHHIIGAITATHATGRTHSALGTALFRPRPLALILAALLNMSITLPELITRIVSERSLTRHIPPDSAAILTFFVDTRHQRRGIGSQLLAAVRQELRRHPRIFVDTEITNANAISWYTSHGFTEISRVGTNVIFTLPLMPKRS
jgi:ribosomal protein S18 acetylase RimI-like enzyme